MRLHRRNGRTGSRRAARGSPISMPYPCMYVYLPALSAADFCFSAHPVTVRVRDAVSVPARCELARDSSPCLRITFAAKRVRSVHPDTHGSRDLRSRTIHNARGAERWVRSFYAPDQGPPVWRESSALYPQSRHGLQGPAARAHTRTHASAQGIHSTESSRESLHTRSIST